MVAPPTIVVVGAGHAGVEAAWAASRMGCRVHLVTQRGDAIARMSCNPAIGGLGKGHLVREIDALGGLMGLAADATGIQFRRLNTRKGAAVRGTRVQSDKQAYSNWVAKALRLQPNIEIVVGEVVGFRISDRHLAAVGLASGDWLNCDAAVLTTGTFLSGLLHVGSERQPGGRMGEAPASALSQTLCDLGFRLGRLKTGTPCRIRRRSVDTSRLTEQPGDAWPPRLSHWSDWPAGKPPMPQVSCHITHTNERTHEIIRANLGRAPIYSGQIQSRGPRYCPSIEDKVVRFADRDRHQIFVEPEGIDNEEVYPNGISTSLPADVQEAFVHTIEGFERAEIVRHGYAVEYDYNDPLQLKSTLELAHLGRLFLAGQINGTTGYEEAAAQGLVAGVNAVCAARCEAPFTLRRDQAYMGVLVDDLVTKGVGGEPYRMFTSRAEYRLLLREDNAASRLTPLGRKLGLIDDTCWAAFSRRQATEARIRTQLAEAIMDESAVKTLSQEVRQGSSPRAFLGRSLFEVLRQPDITVGLLSRLDLLRLAPEALTDPLVAEQIEIDLKYQPYLDRQSEQANRLATWEHHSLPDDLDYQHISGLSNEVREKLMAVKPSSLGQALRVPGVTPAAVALLGIHLRARSRATAD